MVVSRYAGSVTDYAQGLRDTRTSSGASSHTFVATYTTYAIEKGEEGLIGCPLLGEEDKRRRTRVYIALP